MSCQQVMHEFPVISTDSSMATTSRKDFVTHDVTALARQRRDALNTNRVSLFRSPCDSTLVTVHKDKI